MSSIPAPSTTAGCSVLCVLGAVGLVLGVLVLTHRREGCEPYVYPEWLEPAATNATTKVLRLVRPGPAAGTRRRPSGGAPSPAPKGAGQKRPDPYTHPALVPHALGGARPRIRPAVQSPVPPRRPVIASIPTVTPTIRVVNPLQVTGTTTA